MDPFLRGFTEQLVDLHLEEKEIKNMRGIVEIFGLIVKSKLDAQLGFFLGCSYTEFLMQFLVMRSRLPNKEETLQFFSLLKRRFPEILNEIKKVKKSEIKESDEEVTPISEVEVEPLQPTQG